MELIKITEQNGKQAVSLKELYIFLEIGENWTDWSNRMLSYGFEKDIDYQAISVFRPHPNGFGGTTVKDYALTIDTAKEISMIQRSEKGKQARKYFIECERKLKNPVAALSRIDLARMVIEAEEEKERLQIENNTLRPKAIIADALDVSNTCVLVRDVAYQIKKNGFDIGQDRLFDVLRLHGMIHKNNTKPTQKALELGLFEVQVQMVQIRGVLEPKSTTKVTGKGTSYILNKFINGEWKPLPPKTKISV